MTYRDLMSMCVSEYMTKIGELFLIDSITLTGCNMCAIAYDYIARGDY